MNIWWKKIVSVFITVLILGSVIFPTSSVFAQPSVDTTSSSTNITTPQTQEQIMSQTGSGFQESQPSLPTCGLLPGSDGTLEGCFVVFFYYVFLYPSAWIAAIAGQIFDFFIAYTLNSDSYHSGGFVEQGWRVVRDIANASFIFILLFAAITFIVKQDTPSLRRILTRVILVAIVINFSLFMTRAIVDAGNILARVFYEKIVVENDDLAASTQYTTISAGLLNKVNPQSILTGDMFQKKYTVTSNENIQDNTLGGEGSIEGFAVGSGFMILIILIAAIINIALAWIFVSVCVFLVGRTLGLWIMMIMSPVAFASISIPFVKIPKFSFNEWLNKTLTLSFMGVVFLFFLYLTVMFIDISFDTLFNVAKSNMSTVQRIMSVIVPVAIIVFLLYQAKEQAKSMAGDFGGIVTSGLKKAIAVGLGGVGLAAGAAAGVGAVAGRQIVGRAGSAIAQRAGTNTALGRATKRTGKYLSTSSFDARNVKIPKPINKITGIARTGLSYATNGAVKADDFKITALNTFGNADKRGYNQRKEDYIKKKEQKAQAITPDNQSRQPSVVYQYNVPDPNNPGQMMSQIGRRENISAEQAQRDYQRHRAQIEEDHDYADLVENQNRTRDAVAQSQREYEIIRQQHQSNQATQQQLDDANNALRTAQTNRDSAKQAVRDVEQLWVEQKALSDAASRGVRQAQQDFYRNYADTIRNWNPLGVTGRGEANREAAEKIEGRSYNNS